MEGGPRRWIPARSSGVLVSQTLCGARAGPGGPLPGPAQDQRGVARLYGKAVRFAWCLARMSNSLHVVLMGATQMLVPARGAAASVGHAFGRDGQLTLGGTYMGTMDNCVFFIGLHLRRHFLFCYVSFTPASLFGPQRRPCGGSHALQPAVHLSLPFVWFVSV